MTVCPRVNELWQREQSVRAGPAGTALQFTWAFATPGKPASSIATTLAAQCFMPPPKASFRYRQGGTLIDALQIVDVTGADLREIVDVASDQSSPLRFASSREVQCPQ